MIIILGDDSFVKVIPLSHLKTLKKTLFLWIWGKIAFDRQDVGWDIIIEKHRMMNVVLLNVVHNIVYQILFNKWNKVIMITSLYKEKSLRLNQL